LAKLANNKYLTKALTDIRDLIDWMGQKALLRRGRMLEVQEEHAKILAFLKKRDAEKAAEAMNRHIVLTRDVVLGSLFARI